ncbi:MAG: lysylphosphatidylglycerol synthase domain-containing protein, partial [Bryobacteraceae bacterium]
LLERIYDLLIVILLFGFALTRADPDQASLGPALEWVIRTGGYFVAGLGAICVVVLIMAGSFSRVFEERVLGGLSFLSEANFRRAEQLVRAFSGGMESTRSRYFVLQVVLYSLAEWLIIVTAIHCIFKAYPRTEHFAMMDTTMFVAFIAFGSVVQVPGIGGGMQVAAVLILSEFFGLSLEVSSGLAVLIWLMSYVLIIPAGLVLAFREGLNWKTLRYLEEKTAA